MRRRTIFLILTISIMLLPGCRREGAVAETSQEAQTDENPAPSPPPDVRKFLDEIEPAIPLWPGARAESGSLRNEGVVTIVDLWSNDPLPMIWHYYVNYLAQYRAWDPLDEYPSSSDAGRHLSLDLNEVMQDPFVPGTALSRNDVDVSLDVREDSTTGRVNIRYTVRQKQ